MMYKHQIDEIIKRLVIERRMASKGARPEHAEFIQQKIDSWYEIRKDAPEAAIGAKW